MRVTPKSEAEIASENLLTAGIYDFEVVKAEDQVSKASGNDMIKLTLHVYDADGTEHLVFDYLLDAMAAKLRHAAEVFGMLAKYERGALISDEMVGKTGKVNIIVRKNKDPQYADQNAVKDYVIGSSPNAPTSRIAPRTTTRTQTGGGDIDDEIPFGPEWR